jgi:SnoaL-like polyketide cyclase
VRAEFEALNAGDLDACVELARPDLIINLGITATGRPVSYVSHEFYRIADGLIAEEWICSDMAGLLRQIA